MKILVGIALLSLTAVSQATTTLITDGNSLSNGLRLFEKLSDQNQKITHDEMEAALCAVSYVNGFLYACGTLRTLGHIDLPFDLPERGIEVSQFVKMVEKYLNDHPQELHTPADFICYMTLAEGFPKPR
jgi:hypothetical protein